MERKRWYADRDEDIRSTHVVVAADAVLKLVQRNAHTPANRQARDLVASEAMTV